MSRYIDADALQEHIEKRAIAEPWVRALMNAMVDDEPTADVRKNVRGEWIKTKYADTSHYAKVENYECNICKTSFSYHTDTESRPNFCQNCGADMRDKE